MYSRLMQAVVFDEHGDEGVLHLGEVPSPDLGDGEVRIQVAASGVNRADLLQRKGLYPPPPGASEILGLECAGTVIETGRDVSGFTPGDRVLALLTGGGYAEEVVVPEPCVLQTPARLTDVEAAGVAEVFVTAFLGLFRIGCLDSGQTALVHGGSGGVGTAAIQLAKASGAGIFVTAGSAERCRRCEALGANRAFDYREEDLSLIHI